MLLKRRWLVLFLVWSGLDSVGVRACALLVQHFDSGAFSFWRLGKPQGSIILAFLQGFNHVHGVYSAPSARWITRLPMTPAQQLGRQKQPSQTPTSAFTPKT